MKLSFRGKRISFSNTISIQLLELTVFCCLFLSYILVISRAYAYMGFLADFSFQRLLIAILVALIFIQSGSWLNKGLLHTAWHMILIICLFPQLIYYALCSGDIRASAGYMVFLIVLMIFSKLKLHSLKSKVINIREATNQTIILIIAIVLFLPFLYYLPHIELQNLWFKDMYATRLEFREIEPFKGSAYLFMPLSRVLLPALLIASILKRRTGVLIFILVLIAYLYLASGASKSILFGAVAALFFYYGKDYLSKLQLFLISIAGVMLLGILEYYILDSSLIQSIFIRRVFFIPPLMEETYYTYFGSHDKTYYTHSILSFLGNTEFETSLPRFIGEEVMNQEGLNANVGIVPDGFLSLGWLGILINSTLISYTFLLLDRMKIQHVFFGIIFTYLFYFNSSSLGTLILTHGFAFLILFAFFCLKNYEQ